VADRNVHFLDSRRHRRRHDDQSVAGSAHLASRAAGEPDRLQSHSSCLPQTSEHVRAVTRRGNSDGDIALASQSFNLALKQGVKSQVVAAGRQRRRIGRQRDGRNRGSIRLISDDQLRRDMLRIRGAAAVSEQQKLAATTHPLFQDLQRLDERPSEHLRSRLEGTAMLVQFVSKQDFRITRVQGAGRILMQHNLSPKSVTAN
jgi:hypothetical protein